MTDLPFPHTAILASAGSGKTYALTTRYLRLVAAGTPPGSILATSFTRVAAGEIRDRILERLAAAADDDAVRRSLAADIGRPGLDRAGVLELLRRLAGNMHRLQLRTLDSFFASVLRSFSLELGLSPDVRVADEDHDRLLRHEALRRLLEGSHPGNMTALLARLAQGAPERSVMRLLEERVGLLHALDLDADRDAWDCVRDRLKLPREKLAEAARRLAAVPTAHATTLAEDCIRLEEQGLEAFLRKGLAKVVLAGGSSYRRKPIEPGVVAAMQPIIDHAAGVEAEKLRHQSLATHELLQAFDAEYARLKRERRLISFDDLPAAVAAAAQPGRLDEVLFRIDAAIRHLLFDEFQDTSVQQWRAIEPLVAEVAAHAEGRSFFCVGDVKQSIYGWRDACPEILEGIAGLIDRLAPGRVRTETLAVSRRSAQPVIDCVNEVFEHIGTNPALADHPAAAQHFARSFTRHGTVRKDPGFVELRTAPAPRPGRSAEDERLIAAADLAAGLHRRGPGRTVGVLVATNRAVARVLRELGPGGHDVPASGRGGGPLTDTPAVNAVLDALRLADHPDDTVSAFNVARGPLGPVAGLADEAEINRRHQVARDLRRRLAGEGYAAVIREWVAGLSPSCDERSCRRLHELVALAGEHDRHATLRAGDFVRLVEARVVPTAQPAPIEIMTIHQSKGLEFDIVVLPDLEGELAGQSPPVAFHRENDIGRITRICPWVSGDVRALLPELKDLFDHAKSRMVRESLCELYVAMTRARQGLFMIVDPMKNDPFRRPSGIVVAALASAPCAPGTVLSTHGDDAWIATAPAATPPAEAAGAPRIALPGAASPRRAGAAAAAASSAALGGRRLAVELELPDAEARDRGTALHELFERVEWIEEFVPDRDALERVASAAAPRRGAAWARQRVDEFLEALESAPIRGALSRGGRRAASLEVQRERSYARLLSDGSLDNGTIDRLEIERDAGGRAAAAAVIDFKSDRLEPGAAAAASAEAAESHRAQLESYRSAAAAMLGLDESAIRMVLLFVAGGQAVEL